MKYLFIHQNFPGQFRFIAKELADDPANQVFALGEADALAGRPQLHPRITLAQYKFQEAPGSGHHYIHDYEKHIRRGQKVFVALREIHAKTGFYPDVIFVHCGWGEGLFLKDVFPNARIVTYAEFFYRGEGPLVGFDPEFPPNQDRILRTRILNSSQLILLAQSHAAISPTAWQKSQYPSFLHDRISIIHEGTDTALFKPDATAEVTWKDQTFKHGDQVVTYVSRGLEHFRGFHVFMRALPAMQARLPNAKFVIVGTDGVYYGRKAPEGTTYREQYSAEVADRVNWDNVQFTGLLPYDTYRKFMQISLAHVYLTYPFVLSWSMLEAMACGCHVVGSETGPVQEIIQDGVNGSLVNFFDTDALADQVAEAVNSGPNTAIRNNARQTILDRFDRERVMLPAMRKYLTSL